MSRLHIILLATVAASLLALPATAQIGRSAEDTARAVNGKSMNPNTGEAGFKKNLQDAKDQKRAADIAEGSGEAKQLGKKALPGSDDQKPKSGVDDGGQLAAKKQASTKKFCTNFCNPSGMPPAGGIHQDPVKTPFGGSVGGGTYHPSVGSQKTKTPEEIKQCVDECIAKGGAQGVGAGIEKTSEELQQDSDKSSSTDKP